MKMEQKLSYATDLALNLTSKTEKIIKIFFKRILTAIHLEKLAKEDQQVFIKVFQNIIFDWTVQIEAKLAEFRGFERMKFFIILGRLNNHIKGKKLV